MTAHRSFRSVAFASVPFVLLGALVLSGCAAGAGPAASPQPSPVTTEEPAAEAPAEASAETPEATPPRPDLDQATLDGRLRAAAWANDVASAEQLISWGADVNAKDATQQSAYLISTSEGHLEFLRLTLAHGADVQALDSWNGTGLIRAAERGHWDVVGELIQSDVPLDHVNRVGYQAIHEDVWTGRDDDTYFATTWVLYAGGADITSPSVSEGMTPLQMAHYRGFSGQVAVLEAILNEPVPADPTRALLEAAEQGNASALAAALRAGADATARNGAGQTAFEAANAGHHILAAQILTALGHASR